METNHRQYKIFHITINNLSLQNMPHEAKIVVNFSGLVEEKSVMRELSLLMRRTQSAGSDSDVVAARLH